MASSLPGSSLPSQGKPAVASSKKPAAPSEQPVDDGKIEELSFGEIRELEKELAGQQQAKLQQGLEEVRKKKEADELSGKPSKEVQKVSISEVKSAPKTTKRGGLPEHIAALPKEHPIRQRWEKGFRQRPDGSWVKAAPAMDTGRTLEEWIKFLGVWLVAILVLVGLTRGLKVYRDTLKDKREEVVQVITQKGLALDDPAVKSLYREAVTTSWLPTLEKLLESIRNVPRNFDIFPDNPEDGSYMDHIERHGKQFDEREALEWQTREIRKPKQAK